MARAICVSSAYPGNFTAYGCPVGYMPLQTANANDVYMVGEQVSQSFKEAWFQLVDINTLELGGSNQTGATQTMGIFDSIPVQDVLVIAFLFVMFGLGFIGGIRK